MHVACFFRCGCHKAVLGTIAAINLDDRALIAINYERIALWFSATSLASEKQCNSICRTCILRLGEWGNWKSIAKLCRHFWLRLLVLGAHECFSISVIILPVVFLFDFPLVHISRSSRSIAPFVSRPNAPNAHCRRISLGGALALRESPSNNDDNSDGGVGGNSTGGQLSRGFDVMDFGNIWQVAADLGYRFVHFETPLSWRHFSKSILVYFYPFSVASEAHGITVSMCLIQDCDERSQANACV